MTKEEFLGTPHIIADPSKVRVSAPEQARFREWPRTLIMDNKYELSATKDEAVVYDRDLYVGYYEHGRYGGTVSWVHPKYRRKGLLNEMVFAVVKKNPGQPLPSKSRGAYTQKASENAWDRLVQVPAP